MTLFSYSISSYFLYIFKVFSNLQCIRVRYFLYFFTTSIYP
nr:MAG TPA: hypothetical protein [Caudoviricetes sp.]